jgi:hypothetical protein
MRITRSGLALRRGGSRPHTGGLDPALASGWSYLQPQLLDPAVPQHDAFSDAAQHDVCSVGEQQAELLVAGVVFSCWATAVVCCCLSVLMCISFMFHGLLDLSAHTERRTIGEKDATASPAAAAW